MNRKKITKKLISSKKSSLKAIAIQEQQATWQLSDSDIKKRLKRINEDFNNAFNLLRMHTDTVTFFGSARFDENNPYYKDARELARKISRQLKLTIVTGGGPGIMEAANRGAQEACLDSTHEHHGDNEPLICGNSLAMTIELPKEQVTNPYITYSADFYYFFSRKVALSYASRAYIYYPGGFGTMDEFFEILTLKQTNKIPNIPIILCGSQYWKPLLKFIEQTIYNEADAINKNDMNLYDLVDDHEEIIKIIKNSHVNPA